VSSLATRELSQTVVAVAVVAEEESAQLRLSRALAGWPPLRLTAVSSLRRLMATRAPAEVIVTHHKALCADDCEALKRAKTRFPGLVIVAVCECADGRAVRRALDSGIDGLVFADEMEAVLRPSIAAALVGQIVVPRNLRRFLPKPALSPSERRVLGLLVSGYTNSEIGTRLFLAESTVKSHLSSAYTKLGVHSRSEAVSLLLESKEPVRFDAAPVSAVQ
jgi:DNA-binding NarL/FixJ family response regulator